MCPRRAAEDFSPAHRQNQSGKAGPNRKPPPGELLDSHAGNHYFRSAPDGAKKLLHLLAKVEMRFDAIVPPGRVIPIGIRRFCPVRPIELQNRWTVPDFPGWMNERGGAWQIAFPQNGTGHVVHIPGVCQIAGITECETAFRVTENCNQGRRPDNERQWRHGKTSSKTGASERSQK